MSRIGNLRKVIFTFVSALLLIAFLAGCGTPAATTQIPTTYVPAATSTSSALAATIAPTTPRLLHQLPRQRPSRRENSIAAVNTFGNENFLPWLDAASAPLHLMVYDLLVYWDNLNWKFLPGLAERWENSPDGQDSNLSFAERCSMAGGWGEFTAEDVKFNFEMHASPKSIGKTTQSRRITSMDIPDPYTLVVHFKDPYPTFFMDMGMPNSAVCQGIVSKKYVETVGEDEALKKPVGTGPWKLVDKKFGSSMKFEAMDPHWRVVPEFKYLTVRLITETSTLVAMLKTKEIDMAMIPAEQLLDLKTAGVAVEASPGRRTNCYFLVWEE